MIRLIKEALFIKDQRNPSYIDKKLPIKLKNSSCFCRQEFQALIVCTLCFNTIVFAPNMTSDVGHLKNSHFILSVHHNPR